MDLRLSKLFNQTDAAAALPAAGVAGRAVPVAERPSRRGRRDPIVDFALRWWWLLAVGALLGLAASLAYLKFATGAMSYSSTAYLQVNPPTSTASTADKTTGQQSAQEIVSNLTAEAQSPYVQILVSQALPKSLRLSPADLGRMSQGGQIRIEPLYNTNFILITVTMDRPDNARLVADTYASAFVDSVNGQSQRDLAARQKGLQQQIDVTKQNLAVAQLQQRQQDLSQQLRDQRGQLLQIQSNYLQMLQGQLVAERLAPGSTGQPRIDPVAAKQAQDMENQIYNNLKANVGLIQNRLNQINAQLAAIPNAASVAVDQQRLQALVAQQTAQQSAPPQPTTKTIDNQIAQVTAQLAAARVYKQMLDLQSQAHDLQLQLVGAPPAQVPQLQARLADAQNQLAGATGSYKASGWTFDAATVDLTQANLQAQLQSLLAQKQSASSSSGSSTPDVSGQIGAIQARLAQQGQAAQLLDEKQALQSQLSSEQNTLFQMDQQRIQQLANTPAATPTPTSQELQTTQQLGTLSSQVESQWQQEALTQQRDIQKNIDDLTTQLNQVQAALAKLPSGTDLTLMASLQTAYSARLNALTTDYVQVQDSQLAPGPLSRLGGASDSLVATGVRKIYGYGAGAGLVLAAGLAFLLDLMRGRRRIPVTVVEQFMLPIPLSAEGAPSEHLLQTGASRLPTDRHLRRRRRAALHGDDQDGGAR